MLTMEDVSWLKALDGALKANPVVSAERYCAMVEANDRITQQNYLLRQQRRSLVRRLRLERSRTIFWRLGAAGLGALALVFVLSALFKV